MAKLTIDIIYFINFDDNFHGYYYESRPYNIYLRTDTFGYIKLNNN